MAGAGPQRSGEEVRIEVLASHPAFEGHFPGDPILPGVALLDAVLAVVRDRLGSGAWVSGIPSLRWRQAVRPGDVLRARVGEPSREGRISFELLRDDAPVANGSLVLRGIRP